MDKHEFDLTVDAVLDCLRHSGNATLGRMLTVAQALAAAPDDAELILPDGEENQEIPEGASQMIRATGNVGTFAAAFIIEELERRKANKDCEYEDDKCDHEQEEEESDGSAIEGHATKTKEGTYQIDLDRLKPFSRN